MTVLPADDQIRGQHDQYADHFFKGVCICSCKNCTKKDEQGKVVCICKQCPPVECGAQEQHVYGTGTILPTGDPLRLPRRKER